MNVNGEVVFNRLLAVEKFPKRDLNKPISIEDYYKYTHQKDFTLLHAQGLYSTLIWALYFRISGAYFIFFYFDFFRYKFLKHSFFDLCEDFDT